MRANLFHLEQGPLDGGRNLWIRIGIWTGKRSSHPDISINSKFVCPVGLPSHKGGSIGL